MAQRIQNNESLKNESKDQNCKKCGKEASWSEKSGRYYCHHCKSYVHDIPKQLWETIIAEHGEIPKYLWKGMCTEISGKQRRSIALEALSSTRSANARLDNKMGFIVISNKRILFIEETGFLTKNYSLDKSIKLETISGVSGTQGLINTILNVNVDADGISRTLYFYITKDVDRETLMTTSKPDISMVATLVQYVIKNRKKEAEIEKKRAKVQYILDFSFLKTRMEQGGVILQNIKCPSCNASVELPGAGTTFKCHYCGSTIHAEDIFDKMKGLIGDLRNDLPPSPEKE